MHKMVRIKSTEFSQAQSPHTTIEALGRHCLTSDTVIGLQYNLWQSCNVFHF